MGRPAACARVGTCGPLCQCVRSGQDERRSHTISRDRYTQAALRRTGLGTQVGQPSTARSFHSRGQHRANAREVAGWRPRCRVPSRNRYLRKSGLTLLLVAGLCVATLVIGLLGLLAATGLRRGPLLGPLSMTILVLVSTFAIHPLFLLADDDFLFIGRDIRPGLVTAAAIGLLSMLGLLVGYWADGPRKGAETLPVEHSSSSPGYSMRTAGLLSLALVGSWFVIIAVRGGNAQFAVTIFEGRNDVTRSALAGLPVIVGGLPTAAAVLVSAIRIMIERMRSLTFNELVIFWSVVVLSLVPPMALGVRRYLLPCLLAASIAVTAKHFYRRLAVRHLIVGLLGFLILAIVPFVRSTGSRKAGSNLVDAMVSYFQDVGATGAIRPFFTSYDTEMFDYIALMVPRLGGMVPYGLGRGTLGDLALNPLPASALPFPLWSDRILQSVFGGGCADVYCPVASFPGVLYFDFWFPGVMVGSVLLGVACRRYASALLNSSGMRLVWILTPASFAPVLARGNATNVLYIALLVGVVCAMGLRLCEMRWPEPISTARWTKPARFERPKVVE